MPNRLSRFWQELKRRNVIRVVTVYAGAAFVVLELVDMIREPFELPNWSFKLVVAVLAAGLIVAVILSWIYDFQPAAGMVKTEPADEAAGPLTRSYQGWKIASYISFVVILGLIFLNIVPRSGKSAALEKSIAVLPFINDSPDEEKMYFINGTMEAILNNLCMIQDLRVVSRNSVEQYRNNPRPTPVVAEEMGVSYVLEGSGHRDGDKIRLFVQLLDGRKDQHLWSKSYDADIGDIFLVQSEIAQLVASEIEAIITPEEQELIEKAPTSSLIAYEFYQKGLEEHWKYWMDMSDREALRNAERQYRYALEYDSTFALAYTGLATVYWNNNFWKEYYKENFMDSAIILVEKALSIDPQLSEAYVLRGRYYYITGRTEAAIKAFNKALRLNPNNWHVYPELGGIYNYSDLVKSIENFQKAITLNKEPNALPSLLRNLWAVYEDAGFYDISHEYLVQALNLDGDSAIYYEGLMVNAFFKADYNQSLEFGKRVLGFDSANFLALEFIGDSYGFMGKWEDALVYFDRFLELIKELGLLRINEMHRVAHAFWNNGKKAEADTLFNLQRNYCLQDIELGRPRATDYSSYYDLACIYAFRGDTESAMANLSLYARRPVIPCWMVQLIKEDPLLANIRKEPGYQQIVRDMEARYRAEHERVRQWLEENDML